MLEHLEKILNFNDLENNIKLALCVLCAPYRQFCKPLANAACVNLSFMFYDDIISFLT